MHHRDAPHNKDAPHHRDAPHHVRSEQVGQHCGRQCGRQSLCELDFYILYNVDTPPLCSDPTKQGHMGAKMYTPGIVSARLPSDKDWEAGRCPFQQKG